MPAPTVVSPLRAAALLTAAVLAAGCGTGQRPDGGGSVTLPTAGARFDYQIGGGYPPAKGVRVVSRDRADRPASGTYSVCYVNAFQAQPGESSWWRRHHPDLLLHDRRGAPVVDEEWDEVLFDVSTPARRTALADVVGRWIDDCAARGFQAVEPDNLDSFERSRGLLTPAQNAAYARLLAARAHAAGLAVAQKNTAELLPRHADVGFDFAVAEECGEFDECGDYAAAYANRVLVVAYTAADFGRTCRRWGGRLSVVLRDRDVRPAGQRGHVFRTC
ncbi:endo alpha-1,4 polygalactosaminidase [Streptomyces sp. NPDC088732]|uniref:endo alpha-1,4 polygalactosaminidase n=1 Tax=Streptomyces sp. NPDC088732 TaxID=3365879 RepID=UPI003830C19A